MKELQLLKEGQEGYGLLVETDAGIISNDLTTNNRKIFEDLNSFVAFPVDLAGPATTADPSGCEYADGIKSGIIKKPRLFAVGLIAPEIVSVVVADPTTVIPSATIGPSVNGPYPSAYHLCVRIPVLVGLFAGVCVGKEIVARPTKVATPALQIETDDGC